MATETLRPDGAGSETAIPIQYPDSTYHWDKVDEEVADDYTTHVATETVGTWFRDLYALPASSGFGPINKITIYYRVSRSGTSEGSAAPSLRTHSTTYDGTPGAPPQVTYSTLSEEWATNPNTTNAWTWDEIDALEIGVRLNRLAAETDDVQCTQVYVEVDYIPLIYQNVGQGAITPTGALTILPKIQVGSGAITPVGILGRLIKIAVGAGAITPTGAFHGAITFYQNVGEGAVAIAGVLTRLPKIVVGAGSITPEGTLGRFIKIAVGAGAITPTGALSTVLRYVQAVGQGAVAIAGTLGRKVAITVGGGAITPTGSLLYRLGRNIQIRVVTATYRGITVATSLYRKIKGITTET